MLWVEYLLCFIKINTDKGWNACVGNREVQNVQIVILHEIAHKIGVYTNLLELSLPQVNLGEDSLKFFEKIFERFCIV